jgi:excisionase family DNA binding protein
MRPPPKPPQELTLAAPGPHPGGGWIGLDRVDEYLGVAPGVGRRLVQERNLPLYRLPHGDLVVERRNLDACCIRVPEAEIPECLAGIAQVPTQPGNMGVMSLLQHVLERLDQVLDVLPSSPDGASARVPSPTAFPDAGLLTVAEVAGILRCSTKTVRRMISEGVLPASSTSGRAIRIRARDIQRVLHPKTGDQTQMDAFIARAMR